jgi:hypothetical protein
MFRLARAGSHQDAATVACGRWPAAPLVRTIEPSREVRMRGLDRRERAPVPQLDPSRHLPPANVRAFLDFVVASSQPDR